MVTRRTLLAGGAVAVGLIGTGLLAPTASATTTWTVVNCTNLNVRSGPGTGYALVGTLPVGSVISGTASGSWVRIESGTYAGRWVSATYLRAGSVGASSTWIVVNCTNLNVRSGPGTGYALVGTLPVGSVVSATVTGSWARIDAGTYAGRYVSASYLRAGGTVAAPASGYVTAITPVVGGVTIRSGWNGTRVYLIQKRLGMERFGSDQTYDATTRAAVIAFQRSRGLVADGVVGPKTWSALGTGWSFTTDAYQVQPQVPLTATASERVETMIAYALAQRGSRYTWGGAGPYALGFDCSGLVLQAIYAAGRDPQPINVVRHAEPTYRTSRELAAYGGFATIPVGQRRRGDLLFYTNSAGTVHHVTIDLGDGTMMEAYGRYAGVRAVSAAYGSSYLAPYVKRVFG